MTEQNWSDAIVLDFIPDGNLVTFTAMHQADYNQYVRIIDENNTPIPFETLDQKSVAFPITGQGVRVDFFVNGTGKFRMQNNYKIQFASSGSGKPRIEMSNPTDFFIEGTSYGGTALFVTEDGGGTDYNDTSFCLQWYSKEG